MQKLCLRTERLKAGGATLDNAQIGTARAPHRCRLQAVDLLLENLIDALVTTVLHNAGSDGLGTLDTFARDAGGILGEHGTVATNVSGGSGLRSSVNTGAATGAGSTDSSKIAAAAAHMPSWPE